MNDRTLDLFTERAPPDSGVDGPPETREPPPPRVWTVRQVNRASRLLLEEGLPRLWVGGEVTNFRRQRSGHCYFTLKDEVAQLRCVMFRRDAARLPADPDEGMTLRVLGGLTLYEARGVFQLVVSRLETGSEGGMWKLAFDRLRARLDAEGLTDPGRKRALPDFPRTVGVVTSPTGAALRDIVAVIARRAPWLRVLVRGTRVQGVGSGDEIADAVSTLAAVAGMDVIIVARGGGSIEDLWGFNEDAVARAVAMSPVPVVSGVGHETDVTICDLVADLRAATPSAAAEAVAPDRQWVAKRLETMGRRLGRGLTGQVRSRRWWLNQLRDTLFRRGRRGVEGSCDRLEAARQRMADSVRVRIRREAGRLSETAAALDALSPLSTLARGYAVPLGLDGRLLRGTGDLPRGRNFRLRVVDGYVPCAATGRPLEAATAANLTGGDRGR
ncbi:MAG: exodeoxyribonuclease VII large subunit [Gemmatimonadota bacterium]|nr:exodeoxyribonuclease VII large subunit [Gemmatimonadota bacterium]